MRKQNPNDNRNRRSTFTKSDDPKSSSTKYTRLVSFRLPLYLSDDWKEAVFLSGNNQSEILVNLVESYIKFQKGINKPIDDTISQLMEKRERNDRTIIGNALDDAIKRLQKPKFED